MREVPINILKIANDLGLSVRYLNRDDEILYSAIYDKKNMTCYINKNDTIKDQRFMLAHLISHHILGHGTIIKDTERSIRSNSPFEIEANRLASEMLIPEELLYFFVDREANELSDIFLVPIFALKIRVLK